MEVVAGKPSHASGERDSSRGLSDDLGRLKQLMTNNLGRSKQLMKQTEACVKPVPGDLQGDVPTDNSLISLMLRAKNKETGRGLTDKHIVTQSNTFLAAGESRRARKPGGTVLIELASCWSFTPLWNVSLSCQAGGQLPLRSAAATLSSGYEPLLTVRAGYETTANTLSFAVDLLARNPEVERRLVEEISSLPPG